MLAEMSKLLELGQRRARRHLHHQTDQADQNQQIWELLHPGSQMSPAAAGFVKRYRGRLIASALRLDAVLDALQSNGILTTANLEAINIYAVQREKQRVLMDLLLWKGNKAQEAFCKALVQSNPFVVRELDHRLPEERASPTKPYIQHVDKVCYPPQNFFKGPVLGDVLDFLVPDELKCFQWLTGDGVTKERSPVGVTHSSGTGTQRRPGKDSESPQVENVAKKVLSRIVPALTAGICLEDEELVTSEGFSDVTMETNMDPEVVKVTPEVFEDGTMFRLRCQHPGVFRCSLTGLELVGAGEVLYQPVPWDLDFLSSKGLRPAGPLFRFTLLEGRFQRLHLPHCQLLPEGGQHFLSVVHATEERVDVLAPRQVTEEHVVVDVSGFSCFGLVTSSRNHGAISGLVLLFRCSECCECSLFVLLLPRNICLTQVIKEWKQRIRAKYVETIPDCELIPNQSYSLSGRPVQLIQPETSKFVNFNDYSNFLPSFQVQLPLDATSVELRLSSHVTPLPLIGWLFSPREAVVWHRVVQLRAPPAAGPAVDTEESVHATLSLLQVLQSLGSEDFRLFQYHLKLQPDPIAVSQLENAGRSRTVELMVQQYCTGGARQVAEEILRTMKFHQLAEQLS